MKNTRLYTASLFSGLALLISACGGGGYQAPVSDHGERQVINAPIIVDSSAADNNFRTETPRPVLTSSSGNNAAAVNSPLRSSSGATNHRVRAGDTLFSIAFQYDLDFRNLAIANGLSPPYTIFVDQEINLDLNNIARGSSTIVCGNIGTAVTDNSVARVSTGGVSSSILRQPVASSAKAVQWQWPHQGHLLRGFQPGINKGLDISGDTGDPVFAAGDGDVVYSGRGIQGTGDLIIIRHSDRYLSAYAHNSVMLVSEGSHVRVGEKIAEVGENQAGVSMLHFEIRQDGNSVNPSKFLPAR